MRIVRAALAASVLVLAGCGDDDDRDVFGPHNLGLFTGEVTGAVSESLSGMSDFFVAEDGLDHDFYLFMMDGPPIGDEFIVTLIRQGRRPTIATYAIGEGASDFSGDVWVGTGGEPFVFVSGTVTITASGPGGVEGTIDVSGLAAESGETVHVTGQFRSECLEDRSEGWSCS